MNRIGLCAAVLFLMGKEVSYTWPKEQITAGFARMKALEQIEKRVGQ